MATVTQALTEEERKIYDDIEKNDDYKKNLIKAIIRYEVDSYEITDAQHQDPIVIPDEFIDANMEKYEQAYDEVIDAPYLNMDASYKVLQQMRMALKANSVFLFTKRRLIEEGLSSSDPDSPFFDEEDRRMLDPNVIKKADQENEDAIKVNDGSRLLVEYLMKLQYGGKDMSQIELILEKLNFDVEQLNASTDSNKEFNLKATNRAINIISKIGDSENDEWSKYLKDTVVTDKRALNLAKEISKNNARSIGLIDKIFGPEMSKIFSEKLVNELVTEDTEDRYNSKMVKAESILLLYTLAKKIESSMKSKDSKSLIYRGYVIHYMLDDDGSERYRAIAKLFNEVFDSYNTNKQLINVLKTF